GREIATCIVDVTETYTRFQPVDGVAAPCAAAVLHGKPAAVTVRLVFSDVRGNPGRDLLVHFGREVVACMSHDAFVHPWQVDNATGEVPCLDAPWAQYAFPLLLVEGSHWLASFSDSQVGDGERAVARHFRFVSLANIVDVLALGDVEAEWILPALQRIVEADGRA
ncbi:MAG TPA: hypothetical protein VFS08_10175, partial [Gemmatimonadaceae bacterium]|nr:hypothetical protein [Gemmatimonadaceae bacterium]